MTTKHRFRQKYRLEIREDDHLPPHAHLAGAEIDVVISLETLACHRRGSQGAAGGSACMGCPTP